MSMVWYVSYGSNLDPDRLGTYLGGGTPDGGHFTYRGARDASPPRARRPCRVPHDLYFAGESRTWGGGIAFLDHEHVSPAPTLGHAYLVTAEQFEDVAAQETGREHAEVEVAEVRSAGSVTLGPGRYDRVVWLGDVDDVPQLTFTSPEPSSAAEAAAPRPRYLHRILVGLEAAHGMTPAESAAYLRRSPGVAGHWSMQALITLASEGPE
jgi:hypothetical protein